MNADLHKSVVDLACAYHDAIMEITIDRNLDTDDDHGLERCVTMAFDAHDEPYTDAQVRDMCQYIMDLI